MVEKTGFIELNELLTYDVPEKYQNEVSLHVTENLIKDGPEMLALLREGMRQLASTLASDPNLKNIHQITGYSWIVYQHPNLMERLGFEISERDETKKEALATISREKFLELYGGEG